MMVGIELRAVDEANATKWAAWSADEEVRRFLEIRHSPAETVDQASAWIATLDPKCSFALFFDDSFVGLAWVRWVDHEHHDVRTMVVLIRDKRFWGRGIAAFVSLELMRRFPCRKWIRFTYGSNARMQRVMQKSGFHLVAEIPRYFEFEGTYTSRQIWCRDFDCPSTLVKG